MWLTRATRRGAGLRSKVERHAGQLAQLVTPVRGKRQRLPGSSDFVTARMS
jgi:hypothetical protein